jgi:aspartate-semialdehyde dehydrogenase
MVGREILRLLMDRRFPMSELTLFSSKRSAGTGVEVAGELVAVELLKEVSFLENTDLALCSAGKAVSELVRSWVQGTRIVVVDNSSAFRMDPEVPLVVPEVNPQDLRGHKNYIANPNCSTIQLVVALKPLHDAFGLKRVVVSTYQSVSGAGQKGMDELSTQVQDLFSGKSIHVDHFPQRIAFNCIPHIGTFGDNGYTDEEMKMTNECRKIMGIPDLKVSCTAVRVPVFSCHSESVMIEFQRKASQAGIREVLSKAPGVLVADEPGKGIYPTPAAAVETPEVHVGRIRPDISGKNAFHMWVVSDNLWKGAALNAVQIAEQLVKDKLL